MVTKPGYDFVLIILILEHLDHNLELNCVGVQFFSQVLENLKSTPCYSKQVE